ncbi:MAG: hypothetical protein K2R93_20715 [Gemmatimonadaceae bacterium]|nr:hypothetical protein [Gemmatimonadaceae bacterium]
MQGGHRMQRLLGTVLLVAAAMPLRAQSTAAKRDTTKASVKAPSTAPTKAPAATTAKPSSTTAKPATTTAKPGSTTAKPATTAPTSAPTATRSAPSTRAATSHAPIGKPAPFDEGGSALYGGLAAASLSFNAGPMAGFAWRRPLVAAPLSLRADVAGSYHTQPTTVSGLKAATLIHAGASAGLELTMRRGPGMRPYVGGAVGLYRFQASGLAGKAAINAGDIFASTTDVAGIATLGVRLNARLFVEGRYITVGDFTSMPISVGVRF